ncbi:MAG: 4-hydroxy-tetrahydrodipicolinate synthase [Bacteroidales bacterium]|nr:4-hydroxy-tetrahydrodipicolinate synthase [Bacteroidales bacterium]MBN2762015.1 4-hydroxy-tetrahydrodipicolinate synthase [Bacteroidales bacterium]
MSQKSFTGTGVAIVTPFRNDCSIDFKSLEKILEHIISGGVDYAVVLGTTGESVTLSRDEKKAVINFVIDTVDKRIPVVVGIGGNNTQEILNNISSTEFDNIDAVLSVSPYYNKPSQQGIYQHFKAITTASPVPVIVYNVPGRTGSNITAETTLRLAHDFSSIVAIKEASGNLGQIMQIVKNKPKNFHVISGDDALTLPMISVGAAGVISVVANAFPKEFSSMVNYALKGEIAKASILHYKLLDIINALFEEGSPSGIKAVLEILKYARNNVRLPLAPVSEKHYAKLEALVKKIK